MGGRGRGAALRDQRAELRPLQDLRHQGPEPEHRLGAAGRRRRTELREHVTGAALQSGAGRAISVVDLAPVSHGDHEYDQTILFDRRDDAIVAHTIAPQALEVARKRTPEAARIVTGRDAFSQVPQDQAPGVSPELAQIARGVAVELDPPDARIAHCGSPLLQQLALQLFERYAPSPAREPPLREMVILEVLDVAQDRLARVEAFA